MKKLIEDVEVEGESFEALLGTNVLLFCMNYIYAGKLVGVNTTFVQIEGAQIVYETGPFSSNSYKDAQNLPSSLWYIQRSAIESLGIGN